MANLNMLYIDIDYVELKDFMEKTGVEDFETGFVILCEKKYSEGDYTNVNGNDNYYILRRGEDKPFLNKDDCSMFVRDYDDLDEVYTYIIHIIPNEDKFKEANGMV